MRAFFLALLLSTPLLAQPSLLAELQNPFGNCFDCPPTTTTFEILLRISGAPAPIGERAEWSITASPSEVGQAFSMPSSLVPYFNTVLTYSGTDVSGFLSCCNGSSGVITSDNLTHGTQTDRVRVNRIAPVLGQNFFGYHITGLTMTIDELTYTQVSSNQFRTDAEYTARIYGEPVPPLLGDFNVNGTVDAADFVVWRDRIADNALMPNGVGTALFQGRAVPQDYDAWRAHFRETVIPSAAGLASAVPEPAAVLLAICTIAIFALRRHG
jgi:hypothetical protein